MAKILTGSLDGRGKRVGIAVARFNAVITERLLAGAQQALAEAGVAADDITVCWVPGAFELPAACHWLLRDATADAAVMLGAIVRGETDHYDHICRAVADGAMRIAMEHPLGFGVLTCQTIELALARAGGAAGNKGIDAAQAALAMANVRGSLHATPRT